MRDLRCNISSNMQTKKRIFGALCPNLGLKPRCGGGQLSHTKMQAEALWNPSSTRLRQMASTFTETGTFMKFNGLVIKNEYHIKVLLLFRQALLEHRRHRPAGVTRHRRPLARPARCPPPRNQYQCHQQNPHRSRRTHRPPPRAQAPRAPLMGLPRPSRKSSAR